MKRFAPLGALLAAVSVAQAAEVPENTDATKIEGHPLTSVVITQCNLIVAVYMTMPDGKLLRFDRELERRRGQDDHHGVQRHAQRACGSRVRVERHRRRRLREARADVVNGRPSPPQCEPALAGAIELMALPRRWRSWVEATRVAQSSGDQIDARDGAGRRVQS